MVGFEKNDKVKIIRRLHNNRGSGTIQYKYIQQNVTKGDYLVLVLVKLKPLNGKHLTDSQKRNSYHIKADECELLEKKEPEYETW